MTASYRRGSDSTTAALTAHHRVQLSEGSAIAPEIIAQRGVRSVHRGRELPKGFSQRQRRRGPGILFTVHRPAGETSASFRPDEPDPDTPGRKYEQPSKYYGGPGNVLDVHPSTRHLIGRLDVPVVFVEGIKKADAITSTARAAGEEVLVVAITGVWNWMSDGEPIPDMHKIPVEGRRAVVCFDSDMLHNPSVQMAAGRLAEHLISRRATVEITYLPDKPDGSKMGADDFLAAGGTLRELRLLTRPYDPDDFARVRLTRSEKLRLAMEDLVGRFWATEWKGMGGYSARDGARVLMHHAERHGKLVDDGVRVVLSNGTFAAEAAMSTRTAWKVIKRLEEVGFLYRDNEGREPDKPGAFVLRAAVSHYGTEQDQGQGVTNELQSLYAGDLHLRVPCLRWSQPKYTPRRGVASGTRKVRQARKPQPRPAIKRLGKIRGAELHILDASGGAKPVTEIAAARGVRARDVRRRDLPELVEAGIVEVEGDDVRLVPDWRERLDEVRKLGREIEADRTFRAWLRVKRDAYHRRHRTPKPHRAPTDAHLKANRPRFAATLEAQRRARIERVRDTAREAFDSPVENGAQKNLELIMNGEFTNVEALVKSVLAYHRVPFEKWEEWREPVLEAARDVVEGARPDAWRDHPLSCECEACLYPEPSYARARVGASA